MKLKLTNHFQMRMNERRISLEHIKKAIKNPDSKKEAFDGKIK